MDIRWAIVLALGLLFASLVHGGMYEIVAAGGGESRALAWRVNKFTGNLSACDAWICVPATWREPVK